MQCLRAEAAIQVSPARCADCTSGDYGDASPERQTKFGIIGPTEALADEGKADQIKRLRFAQNGRHPDDGREQSGLPAT